MVEPVKRDITAEQPPNDDEVMYAYMVMIGAATYTRGYLSQPQGNPLVVRKKMLDAFSALLDLTMFSREVATDENDNLLENIDKWLEKPVTSMSAAMNHMRWGLRLWKGYNKVLIKGKVVKPRREQT